MTRITNAEQVLMLLRAHLDRAQRATRKRTQIKERKSGVLERVQHLAEVEGLSEADIAKALIAGLLAEEFGAAFAAEPRFQSVVEEVHQIIDRDEAARTLVFRAVRELATQG